MILNIMTKILCFYSCFLEKDVWKEMLFEFLISETEEDREEPEIVSMWRTEQSNG